MGTFSVTMEVGSPDQTTWREVEVLVDTGATYTWLPRSLLLELGHKPGWTKSFKPGDGRIIDADVGDVPVRIAGEIHVTTCALADNGAGRALGAVTMEQFLLAPDPISKRLVPVVGLAMSRV